jgi:hypothetical protein
MLRLLVCACCLLACASAVCGAPPPESGYDRTPLLLGQAGILPPYVAAILQLMSDLAAGAPLQVILEDVMRLFGFGG